MTTIFSYMTKQLFVSTVAITLVQCMIFWLAKASTLLDFILNRGLDFGFFLYMSALILPRLLIIILPIATFVALLLSYYRLQSDSELVVMRAAGTSTFTLAKPGLAVGGVISITTALLTLYLLPASYREFKDQEFAIRQEFGAVLLQEGAFNSVAPGITVFVHKRGANRELLGIMLHDNRDTQKPQTWLAEQGALVSTSDGPRVVLVRGNRQQVERDRGKFSMLVFDQTTLDIANTQADQSHRWREPRERFLGDLFDPKDTSPNQPHFQELRAEGHNRLIQPFLPLTCAAVTLALLLSGSYSRRGQTVSVLSAVVIIIVILVGSLSSRSLAGKQPLMIYAMYANAILPLLVALYYLAWPRRILPSWLNRHSLRKIELAKS